MWPIDHASMDRINYPIGQSQPIPIPTHRGQGMRHVTRALVGVYIVASSTRGCEPDATPIN
jgi:hypothetical protein